MKTIYTTLLLTVLTFPLIGSDLDLSNGYTLLRSAGVLPEIELESSTSTSGGVGPKGVGDFIATSEITGKGFTEEEFVTIRENLQDRIAKEYEGEIHEATGGTSGKSTQLIVTTPDYKFFLSIAGIPNGLTVTMVYLPGKHKSQMEQGN